MHTHSKLEDMQKNKQKTRIQRKKREKKRRRKKRRRLLRKGENIYMKFPSGLVGSGPMTRDRLLPNINKVQTHQDTGKGVAADRIMGEIYVLLRLQRP